MLSLKESFALELYFMKRFSSILVIFILLSPLLKAQIVQPHIEQEEQKASRWRFGGAFGLGGGNDSFSLNISPEIGYMVTEKMESGISIGYLFNKFGDSKHNIFSAGMYTNYRVISELLLRVHFETLMGNNKYNGSSRNFREEALWIGAGYQTSGRVSFSTGLMYNVLHKKDKSVFSSPLRPFGGISISF